MEEIGIIYKGLLIGFLIAAPVGPVGLLCIRRTIQNGIVTGLATGLGAAIADGLFGAIAVLGVTAVLAFITDYSATIRILGGLIIAFAAWHTWFDKPKQVAEPKRVFQRLISFAKKHAHIKETVTAKGLLSAMTSSLAITLTNPLTLFGTLAVVGTVGSVSKTIDEGIMIVGIFVGSALWWMFLSVSVGLFRHLFTEDRIIILNRFTAVFLWLIALWALISGIRDSLY
ncbi:MAG: LysE family transporter [Alphaproteobacteria bacterium]|nr:LysE family transporter [Alphaproteobacteria bacterium]MCL2505816.1 LysE family transporter [Alphaproteobacteria bacterium]